MLKLCATSDKMQKVPSESHVTQKLSSRSSMFEMPINSRVFSCPDLVYCKGLTLCYYILLHLGKSIIEVPRNKCLLLHNTFMRMMSSFRTRSLLDTKRSASRTNIKREYRATMAEENLHHSGPV